MSLLRIYWACLRQAVADLGRAPWVVLLPVGYGLLIAIAMQLLGPLPQLVQGFALGFLEAALAASFLFVLDELVGGSRVRLKELPTSAGRYLWPVVNVLFVFWIAELVLDPLLATLPNGDVLDVVLRIALLVVLNATPEAIYVERQYGGLATIGASVRFLQAHWIEWLAPNGLLVAAVWFGLPRLVARLPLWRLGLVGGGLALGAIYGAVLLPAMLLRGHLYRRLAAGGRARGDAWREAWRR